MRRLALIPVVALLVATVCVLWSGLLLPPPLWILKYGFHPGCKPTGRTWSIEGVEFVEIGPGISRMGSNWLPKSRAGIRSDSDLLDRLRSATGISGGSALVPSREMPVHWTQFPDGFAMAKTEITNEQFERLIPDHERSPYSAGDSQPVADVTWQDANLFCALLAEQSGFPIRLPREAEWEAACRAGNLTEFTSGDSRAELREVAWMGGAFSPADGPREVGTKSANRWGLFDMHGNVWEWCQDEYRHSYARGTPVTLTGEGSADHVIRGGTWCHPAVDCRSAFRRPSGDRTQRYTIGFRPAFTPPDR